MPRPEKVRAVEDIKERLEQAEAVFLTEYRGLDVGEMQQLRRSLREAGADYRVVKVTLARLAADAAGMEGIGEYLSGPMALAFVREDPVGAAKALRDFAKEHDQLVVKAGFFAGSILKPEDITRLADIEPREVLLAKIAGAAKAPLANFAGLLSAFTRNAASMFSQLLEKKESGEVPAGSPAEASAEAAAASAEAEAAEASAAADDTSEEPQATEAEDGDTPEEEPAGSDDTPDETPAAEADGEED